VLDADEPQTGRRERRIGIRVQDQALPFVPDLGHQSAIVERIGYEPAQIRVQPSRLAQEDAPFRRDGEVTQRMVKSPIKELRYAQPTSAACGHAAERAQTQRLFEVLDREGCPALKESDYTASEPR
jgi:hypothetical protein